MKLNILGADWTVEYRNADADSLLKEDDGYTDPSIKLIVIANKREECSIQDYGRWLLGNKDYKTVTADLWHDRRRRSIQSVLLLQGTESWTRFWMGVGEQSERLQPAY